MSYACSKVERLDGGEEVSIDCSDFVFDGTIDGMDADGMLGFRATTEDYETGRFTPGIYTVTITGTAVGSVPLKEETTFFILWL